MTHACPRCRRWRPAVHPWPFARHVRGFQALSMHLGYWLVCADCVDQVERVVAALVAV